MKKLDKVKRIIAVLKQLYPAPRCMLGFNAPHELLIATRLSAQCTDKRVNITTPALFARFPDINAFAEASADEVGELIKPCGLHKTKAADIIGICKALRDEYGGAVPEDMDELLKLPGVGRKTANLIRGELYGKPAIVADTHVMRLSGRLGLVKGGGKDAVKTEKALAAIVPAEESLAFCHRLVLHGRAVCKARNPACGECGLREFCGFLRV